MRNGSVKWFSDQRGYSFIEVEDRPEIFLPSSPINAYGFTSLNLGDQALFDSAKGPVADKSRADLYMKS